MNLPIQKQVTPTPLIHTGWEPLRQLRNMLGWDPFAEMAPYVLEPVPNTFTPAFDVKETNDAYIFRADVPGLKEADLEIKLLGDRLTIGGKREVEKRDVHDTYYAYERSFGTFTRTFTLPHEVDANATKAELTAGVLTVTLPKRPEAQAKQIVVKAERPEVRVKA
ncbi:MAG TPA: Hsp20/alpha crystallin family protein [Myxococcaceae bacterium]|nr:Hsp20/alpha crystallin family protein [Myxococcaceae bacterium]